MENKIYLPNGMEAYEAVYTKLPIEEYNNNPFIEALPPLADKKTIIENLRMIIAINEEERSLDSSLRIHSLHRIYKVFQPLPIHLEIWNMISTLIRQGYLARNPFDKEYRRYVNQIGKQIINRVYEINSRSDFRTTASCGTLIGISGIGKSSTVNRVLSHIPQIIVHNEYKGQHFNQIQLTWLKLEIPHNASLKALSLQYFMKIDQLLGTDNFRKYISRNLSLDAMLPLMGQVASNIGLGLLVLDELQNLRNGKVNQMMNYFVSLINSFGVNLLCIGTPASYELLEHELRIARRFTGNSEIIWNNMDNNGEFKLLLEGIWKYQFTKKYTALSEEMINVFYYESQGISDLLVKLFVNAQSLAIQSGKEEITVDIVKRVSRDKFKFMMKMLDAIRSKNPYKINQYEDIRRIEKVESVPVVNENKFQINVNKKKIEVKEEVSKNKEIREKHKSKTVNEYEKEDIRLILNEGKNKETSPYQVLLQNGYIDDMSYWEDGKVI